MNKTKKRRKTTSLKKIIKTIIGKFHLWLGLASGLIILISMLAASVYVWELELTDWYYDDIVYHNNPEEEYLSASELLEKLKKVYPDKTPFFLEIPSDRNKNWVTLYYKGAEKPGWTYFSAVEYHHKVYINPFSGEVVGHIDVKRDWISLMMIVHTSLLLEHEFGSNFISIASLFMIVLALSGLYLWWPKKLKGLRRRLTVKWKARFKRVNWDLHSVGGFYTYLFILVFAATGLFFSYTWWKEGTMFLLGENWDKVKKRPDDVPLTHYSWEPGIDIALTDALQRRENWRRIDFSFPVLGDPKGKIRARIKVDYRASWWSAQDDYYYHPETGETLGTSSFPEKSLGQKYWISNYDIHTGTIYGWPSKIVASLCALFFAFLPLSGFLIWYGRNFKKRKRKMRPHKKRVSLEQDTS